MNDDALIVVIGAVGLGVFSFLGVLNDFTRFFYDNGFGSLDFEIAGVVFFVAFMLLAVWYGEESKLMVTTVKTN